MILHVGGWYNRYLGIFQETKLTCLRIFSFNIKQRRYKFFALPVSSVQCCITIFGIDRDLIHLDTKILTIKLGT